MALFWENAWSCNYDTSLEFQNLSWTPCPSIDSLCGTGQVTFNQLLVPSYGKWQKHLLHVTKATRKTSMEDWYAQTTATRRRLSEFRPGSNSDFIYETGRSISDTFKAIDPLFKLSPALLRLSSKNVNIIYNDSLKQTAMPICTVHITSQAIYFYYINRL